MGPRLRKLFDFLPWQVRLALFAGFILIVAAVVFWATRAWPRAKAGLVGIKSDHISVCNPAHGYSMPVSA